MDLHKTKAIVLFCLAISCVVCKENNEPEEFPETINTTTTELGNGKQIQVTDPEGKLLATIDIFENEGYEVQKRTDRKQVLFE
ncbi:hypothetical protein DPMN_088299 [Dreissena polymorpha]|uniref:Uncharacterized protein n=1 Tax=Dreissena polymorpha TaxID=45954 RepID=A0A9D4KUT4_DREPO|nr:hypothetical protein DPMN_088299 [Dreissena polymorpha]